MKTNKLEKKQVKVVKNLIKEMYKHKLTNKDALIILLTFQENMMEREPQIKELVFNIKQQIEDKSIKATYFG